MAMFDLHLINLHRPAFLCSLLTRKERIPEKGGDLSEQLPRRYEKSVSTRFYNKISGGRGEGGGEEKANTLPQSLTQPSYRMSLSYSPRLLPMMARNCRISGTDTMI
ncbi:hypothetical protein LOAG_05639 [Loa loa]|uniref:Uncharacterized protein n=1 Tax=Loa loa TaxID=7209 RepID=A0A1S0U171_LOALO|nr:hypothetical protein LOAG_05639 [Loa loa]EFO22849.1 hypothetical protein LOAG_05639 [Loa loa]